MKFWLLLLITISAILSTSSASPSSPDQYILEHLNKPWFTPDKPQEFPRKGEGCKGKKCKPLEGCDGCQYALPYDIK